MPPVTRTNISISTATIVRVVIAFALVALFLAVKQIVLAVLVSVVIASSLEPVIRFCTRTYIPRTLAVILVYVVLIFIIITGTYFMLPVVIDELVSLVKALPDFISSLNAHSLFLSDIEKALQVLASSATTGEYLNGIIAALTTIGTGPIEVGGYLFGGASLATLIGVLSFYLSAQKDGVGDFLRIVTPLEHEGYVIGLWRRAQKNISRWMQGQLILGLLVGLFVYIGLSVLGIRHALLLALISALFEIIPVFGPILGSLPGIVIGFIDGGVGLALLVAGLYIVIQQLESNVIYPLVVKKVVGVPPIVVIISIIIGITVGGFQGAILSVPIATILMEYLDDRERSRRGII